MRVDEDDYDDELEEYFDSLEHMDYIGSSGGNHYSSLDDDYDDVGYVYQKDEHDIPERDKDCPF